MSDESKKNNCNGGPNLVGNNQNVKENQSGQSNSQSNVRYIPITLDYDDKTVNKENNKSTEQPTANPVNNTKPTSGRYQHSNHFTNDPQKPTSIFDRVKHFPVNLRSTQRNESPGRTIPITVQTECGTSSTKTATSPKSAASPTQPTSPKPAPSPKPTPSPSSPKPSANTHDEVDSATDDNIAIAKIHVIQQEIQCLMDKVDIFEGTRKDKDYMYLDEMLTQNLLKLDKIEAEGRDSIKQARREAIKCVNTCIGVLEAKAEAAAEKAITEKQKSDDKSHVKSVN